VKLLTKEIEDRLLENGRRNAERMAVDGKTIDFEPVVKLFTPDAACTWLLTELDPENPDIAFGLCDLGMGHPEVGAMSLSEIANVRGRFGLPVERDRHFRAAKTLAAYANEARGHGRIG
jgi:hypothetical protein